MLTCAPQYPGARGRSNLRLDGSGGIVFAYGTQVCRQTNQEYFAGG